MSKQKNNKPEQEKNILADFIKSDDNIETNEAEMNDELDKDDVVVVEKSLIDDNQKKLNEIPRKYWKHQ